MDKCKAKWLKKLRVCFNIIYLISRINYNYFFQWYTGREDEAKEILTKLRRSDVDLDKEIQSFKDMNKEFKDVNVVNSFKNKTVLTNLGLVYGIFLVQVFAGI